MLVHSPGNNGSCSVNSGGHAACVLNAAHLTLIGGIRLIESVYTSRAITLPLEAGLEFGFSVSLYSLHSELWQSSENW